MDSVTPSHARLGAPPPPTALPETRAALDTFFRSFGFSSDVDLSRLATWVLVPHGRRASPRDALAVASARVELWLQAVLGPAPVGDALLTRGRAAFVLCDGARRGATVLTEDPEGLPVDFVEALRAAVTVPPPEQIPAAMPEQRPVRHSLAELLRRWW